METVLWILQSLLAAVFLVTGTTKLTQPRAKLAAGPMSWAADVSDAQFRAIGAVEVVGAVGVVLPAALDIAPVLTPIAAVGLAATMAGAVATHIRLGEPERAVPAAILLVMALFVAVARFGPYSL
jgi:uncharacterized membrane protein YphA (DoxX/SURF4 family)